MKLSSATDAGFSSLALRFLSLFAAFVALGSVSTTAYAEEQTADDAEVIEEIVVTGSRIPRTGFDTMLPANVISAELLERRGYTNVADALNEVTSFGSPGNSPGITGPNDSDQSSYSVGQNFVNFFGLGSQRTLTLVNGRRFVSSSAPSLFTAQAPGLQVDLNSIPTSMVERVETISVGGAPVYGADAIAGTVNVILKDDFEGLEIGGNWGESWEENDLNEKTFELLWGGNFADGRGNVVVGLEVNDREGLLRSDRHQLNQGWQWRTPADSDNPFGRVLVQRGTANIVSNGGVIAPSVPGLMLPNFGIGSVTTDGDGNPVYLSFAPDGSLQPYDVGSPTGDAVWSVGGDGIYLPKLTSLFTPVDRKIATAFANYELTDNIEAYGELYVVDIEATELVNQPAYQSGFFGEESAALLIQADHPLLTQDARDTLADLGMTEFSLHRASSDLGDRRGESDNNLWRVVGGLRGDFEYADRNVHWDLAYIKGRSETDTFKNELINANFFYALDVVDVGNGPQCRVVADPSSRPTDPGDPFGITNRQNTFDNCVPLDIFGEGRASDEALAYVTAPSTSEAVLEQELWSFNANTTLFELPAGSLDIAVGFEHREEAASFRTGGTTELGLGRAVPVDATSGAYETNEWYGEIYAPIVTPDMDIPAVYSASVEGAYRVVSNNIAGSDKIYTYGGRWAPVKDVEFRGNVTRSVRAPSVTELFLPLSGTNVFATDPCDAGEVNGGPNPATRRANCVADGIDPDNFSSNVKNASVQGRTGGNQELDNEVADAFTVGVVLRPRWVENLEVAVDYVDIEVEKAIESFSLTQIMESCYDAATFPNTFCDQFNRGPDGQLPAVDAFTSGYVNAGLLSMRGITVEFDWLSDLSTWPGMGNFRNPGSLAVSGNMYFPREIETLILGAVDDELNLPHQAKEQVQVNLTYFWNNLAVFWQTRYKGEVIIEADVDPNKYPDDKLDAQFLHNFGVSYDYNENITVSLNVNNVFDKEPEKSAVARGYDVQYDNIGRYVRAGIKIAL